VAEHREKLVFGAIGRFEVAQQALALPLRSLEGPARDDLVGDLGRHGHHSVDAPLHVPQGFDVELEERIFELPGLSPVERNEELVRGERLSGLVDVVQNARDLGARELRDRLAVRLAGEVEVVQHPAEERVRQLDDVVWPPEEHRPDGGLEE
jgi:hypothetical protein